MNYPNIAFVGGAGAGKTIARSILAEAVLPVAAESYVWLPFAGPLKRIAVEIFGPGSDTNRELLQWLGTDVVRKRDPDAWVRMWEADVRAQSGDWPMVVDDLRFPNEWWAAKAHGFKIVKIVAPIATRIDRLKKNGKWSEGCLEHESENVLPANEYESDVVIANDETGFELGLKLGELMNRWAVR